MLLDGGTLGGARILSPATVARMTVAVDAGGARRARPGWDIDSHLSRRIAGAVSGRLVRPYRFYRHVAVARSRSKSYVIFLSNRVHPDGKGDVTPLRAQRRDRAAAALRASRRHARAARRASRAMRPGAASSRAAARAHAPVLTGIDVLEARRFARLRGKRIGLVTNQTGRRRDGTTTIDFLATAPRT